MNRTNMFCLVLAFSYSVAIADDWPQWQGPNRDAISKETGLLKQWPEGGPKLEWRIDELGGGDSAPAVADGKLFGMSNRDGKETVWALSEQDGKELWATPIGNAVEQRMSQSKEGPGGTPSVDGDHVYVIGMGGTVACLKVANGALIWKVNFVDDFGGSLPAWSYRESPLVDGDKVICTPGSDRAMMVALNKSNGKTIWQTKMQADAEQASEPTREASRPETGRAESRRPSSNAAPKVSGTSESDLFLSEHWGMTAFAQKVPNGKYLAKLYFAETYSGIRGPGGRVFSFNVEGKEFKDFDIWKKADGPWKAYVESVPVEVTDGQFDIAFTPKTQSPAIKAIEIIPEDTNGKTIRIKAGQTSDFKDSKGKVWLADRGFTGGVNSPGFFNSGRGNRGGGRGFGGGRGGRSGAAYSSPIAIDVDGKRQYVQLTAKSLIGVSAEEGEVLWTYDAPANAMGINCSTPIYADGLVFAASAYGTGGGAVKISKNDNGTYSADEVYFTNRMQNHHGGMVVIDGCLYGANGGNGGGFMHCLDFKTGDVIWRDRKGPKGALLLADSRIYLRGEKGEVLLIEPSREGLVERGRFDQPDRSNSPAWAHPVIANGKLYIRDQGLLLCYAIASQK